MDKAKPDGGTTRRAAAGAFLAAPLLASPSIGLAAQRSLPPSGVEGQRRADLGDGRYLNPVLSGDRPDPSVMTHDGAYYLTYTSDYASPGIVIWRSDDLVNWTPLQAVAREPIGRVWAPDLCKHGGRFFIYFALKVPDGRKTIAVYHADKIEGPWSGPVDLRTLGQIDPSHAVGEDGARYLFMSGGDRVRLSSDGLSLAGPVEHVYDAWRYPDDWVVDEFAPEGPKIFHRGGWTYLMSAVGGTAGPVTGHMVTLARSRSIDGPWEHAPNNPIIRTKSAKEAWWSRGHAAPIKAPDGSWWLLYHGYEKGYPSLGRQLLLEPVAWTKDGWLTALGGDLSRSLPKPTWSKGAAHGLALSDTFQSDKNGAQWSFFKPGSGEMKRARWTADGLELAAKGAEPRDSSPLTMVAGDRAYQFEVEVEIPTEGEAGILLFYSERLYCGWGFDAQGIKLHNYGQGYRPYQAPALGSRCWLRVTNDHQIVSLHYSHDGVTWTRFDKRFEVSGYHQNVMGEFRSLRPALYAAGEGRARFRSFQYRALP